MEASCVFHLRGVPQKILVSCKILCGSWKFLYFSEVIIENFISAEKCKYITWKCSYYLLWILLNQLLMTSSNVKSSSHMKVVQKPIFFGLRMKKSDNHFKHQSKMKSLKCRLPLFPVNKTLGYRQTFNMKWL